MAEFEKQFDIATVIAAGPWFQGISSLGLSSLVDAAKVRSYKADDYIYTLGDQSIEVYVVLAGRVRLTLTSSLGQEFALTDMEDNYWFGEAAIIDDTARLFEAQAQCDTIVLAMPRKAVIKVCESNPVVYKNLFKQAIERSRGVYTLLAGLAFYPLRARLAGRMLVLIEEHGIETDNGVLIDIKLSQNDFARLSLGSRQRINKIFREWNEMQIVVQQSDQYCVRDIDALTNETTLQDIE
jgi:CRP-like cAMP-binding protein|tara:strand:- start:1616 stop:2332 length:717 start_codon:yes stop_codon:yes gene_type:complete